MIVNLHAQDLFSLSTRQGMTVDAINQSAEREAPTDQAGEQSMDKRYMRWLDIAEDHENPDGTPANYSARLIRAHDMAQMLDPVNNLTKTSFGNWTIVSPSQFNISEPLNGRLNEIEFHPTNSDIIYVGATFGGVWKTTNGGTSWTPLTDGLPSIGVSDIAVHPTNPNTIYLLTGDGNGRQIPTIGILKSSDGGQTWQNTDVSFGISERVYGYNLTMDPNDPDKMLATFTDRIRRTSNGWLTSSNEEGGDWRDIEFKPGSSDTLYATNVTGAWRSTNGGDDWDDLQAENIGLPNHYDFTRVALGLTSANPGSVYFLYTKNYANDLFDPEPSFKGLYYSSGGNPFALMSNSPNHITGPQSGYDLELTIDQNLAGTVYVGAVVLWKSTNFGMNWTQITGGTGLPSIHADIHRLKFNGTTLYSGTDGGLSKSTDGGSTWTNLSAGLNITQFYHIDVQGNRIMGGTQDNGTLMWNEGDVIGEHILGGDGMECEFDYTDPTIIYASSQVSREVSTDGGNNFNVVTPPLQTGDHWDAPWVFHPTNAAISFAAHKNIWRTPDSGNSWFPLHPPLFPDDSNIQGMALSHSNPDSLYMVRDNTVYLTDQSFMAFPSWSNITNNLPADSTADLRTIEVDNINPNQVWVGFADYLDGVKVFYTVNSGQSWVNISGSLPNVPVFDLLHDTNSTNDGIYAGTAIGVFYYNNILGDWIYFSNGLPVTLARDLKIENNHLYVGTFGRGIWKSPLYQEACSEFITLTPANDPSNPNSTGPQTYEAIATITSTRKVVGGVGTNVLYRAGSFVRLDEGFEAQEHSEFKAEIGGCSQ